MFINANADDTNAADGTAAADGRLPTFLSGGAPSRRIWAFWLGIFSLAN